MSAAGTQRVTPAEPAEEVRRLLRPDLAGVAPYGAPQLDVPVALNTNENSYPVPPQVAEAIGVAVARAATTLNRYLDREHLALRADLATYLAGSTGVPFRAEQLWAANGSNEVLLQLVQAFGGPGRLALGFTPAYSMHPVIAGTAATPWADGLRGTGDPGDVTDGEPFELSAASAVAQVRRHRPSLVLLCSPNNPTGTALDLDVVIAVHDAAPDALVVVDEAYAEFSRPGTPSAVHLLSGRPRLVVTRTMSKAFGMAGARIGYLAADPAVLDALRLVRLPYHLSAPTQAIATTALAHADVLLRSVEALKAERDRVVAALPGMGLHPVASDANFVLFGQLRDERATWQALLERGILVRDVGLPGYLRVSAGTPQETTAFLEAMADLAPTHSQEPRR